MESSPDYSSIVHSPSFTFLVGPEHTKLTIQSALVKHVSRPLDDLMNNGQTRESRTHIAVLEEETVETFVGFCEFAYTGDYSVPGRHSKPVVGGRRSSHGGSALNSPLMRPAGIPPAAPSPPATPAQDPQPEPKPEGDEAAGDQTGGDEAAGWGFDQTSGKKLKKGKADKKKKRATSKSIDETLTPPSTPPPGGREEQKNDDETGAKADGTAAPADWFDFDPPKTTNVLLSESQSQQFTAPPPRPQGMSLWDAFATLEYKHEKQRSLVSLPSPIFHSVSAGSGTNSVPYLLFHAKLYIFATRYLIPTLAQLCLTKLHRDLVKFPIALPEDATTGGDPNAAAVLELLHYTFVNTNRTDPVFVGATTATTTQYPAHHENQLRKLVVHYAACKVRELASYRPGLIDGGAPATPPALSLRQLLDSTCELASDLVFCMM